MATSVVVAAVGGTAVAAPKRITGELTKPGYTVIALAPDGRASSVTARGGAFRLRPRAGSVTLHLRAPDGVYAGPVVIRGLGRRAILGVRAGARLGRVNVHPGYARLARRLARRWLDAKYIARALKSVPIGARVFGRVRSKPPRRSVPGDRDSDGIPNPLDIDDDGDRVLDNLDRSRGARAAQFHASGAFLLSPALHKDLPQTANANAPGLSDAQIEAALPSFGDLGIEILPGDSVELDCASPQSRTNPGLGGLIYCSSGGTGRRGDYTMDPSMWPPFPGPRRGPFDPDGDGFGTLVPDPTLPPGDRGMFLRHGATSAQIGTGDVLIQHINSGNPPVETGQFTATLQFVFATVPALVSYDDDGPGGNAPTPVSYPVPQNGPGTRQNPIPVNAPAAANVVLTLTFWRPQRRPIPGEPGYSDPPTAWTDIGGLNYRASIADRDPGEFTCEQNAYSSADSNLTPTDPTVEPGGGGFRDLAANQLRSPNNTFTYTLNLTRCLGSKGISFNAGEQRGFAFVAVTPQLNANDTAGVSVFFKRQ